MYRAILLILAISMAMKLHAQERIFSDRLLRNTVVPNSTNNFFIVSVFEEDAIRRYYVKPGNTVPLLYQSINGENNSEFKYQGSIEKKMLKDFSKMKQIGGVYNDKSIVELFQRNNNPNVYALKTDLVTGESKIIHRFPVDAHDLILNYSGINDRMILLAARMGSNLLTIYNCENDSVTKKTIRLTVESEGKITELDFRKGSFAIYNYNARYPAYMTKVGQKAFLADNGVTLSFSGSKGKTYVAKIDIEKAEAKIDEFELEEETMNKAKYNPSFIADSFLVAATAGKNVIRLRVYNINSRELLFSKDLNKDNIDSFVAHPIIRTGSFTSKSDINESDFEKFFSTMLSVGLSVSGYVNDNKLFLSFASEFKEINGTSILNTLLDIGGSIAAVGSGADFSNFYFDRYRQGVMPSYTGFDVTLSLNDFKPSKIPPNFRVWDKIAAASKLKAYSRAAYFYMNNCYYPAVFEPQSREFSIYRFNEKKDD